MNQSQRVPARPGSYIPGDIVRAVVRWDGGQKPRPALLLSISDQHLLVRPIYTRPGPSRVRLVCTFTNGLHHDSYLSCETQRIPRKQVLERLGMLDIHLDPFNDFPSAA